MDNDTLREILRTEREFIFKIVNRGKLWYDSLTATQLQELQIWYEAWLRVTDTLIKPQRPNWLK